MSNARTRTFGPEPYLDRIQKRMVRGASLEEAAEAVGIPLWLAKAKFVRNGLPVPRPLQRRQLPNAQAQQAFSEVATLLALRLFSHELGAMRMAPGRTPVRKKEWDAHRDPAQHASASQLVTKYGSWTEACQAAGVPVRKTRRRV